MKKKKLIKIQNKVFFMREREREREKIMLKLIFVSFFNLFSSLF